MARWPCVRMVRVTRVKAANAASAEDGAGADALQNGRADEAADHCATPIDHQEVRGLRFGQARDGG